MSSSSEGDSNDDEYKEKLTAPKKPKINKNNNIIQKIFNREVTLVKIG